MNEAPDLHYVRSPDGTMLAYQVSGQGPIDLVFYAGGYAVDLLWDDPGMQRLTRRLDTFARTLWLQGRGWGASEGNPLDRYDPQIADADLCAALDAVGFRRPAIVGWSGASVWALHFATSHFDRLSALVIIDGYAHYVQETDYQWGIPRGSLDLFAESLKSMWSTGEDVSVTAPDRAGDNRFRAWYSRSRRLAIGPETVADSFKKILESDVRHLLPSISVPTLVLHREGDRFIRPGAGRYLAEHIKGAKFVLLPGDEHLYFAGDADALVDEIEEFLTGARSGAEGDVLTMTVLFTDIVASTEHQARVGPGEWSRLTDRHDAMVRSALAGYRGREVKTTGDGFLATFDAAGRALRCAADILAGANDIGLDLRVGVHTGEVEVRGDDIAGLAVIIAKRVCDLAGPGQMLVSEMVRGHMVGSGIEFDGRGEHELKGVPGTWRLYAVAG